MRRFLLVLGLLSLTACGGSGNAVAGAQSDLLIGDYRYVALRALGGAAASATTARVQSDGVSSLAFGAQTTFSEGAFIGPVIGGLKTYTISPERNFALPGDGVGGRISADGMIAAGATRAGLAHWSLLFRYRNAPALADLAGTWAVLTYARAEGMYAHVALRKVQTIDAAGFSFFVPFSRNFDGEINPPGAIAASDDFFTVEADGTLALDANEGGQLIGDLSEDGNLMVFTGSGNTGFAVVRVMVRLDNLPALQDTDGEYGYSSWQTSSVTLEPTTRWGSWDAAGTDALTHLQYPGQPAPLVQPYVVDFLPNGTVSAVASPAIFSHRLVGAFAASGNYGFVNGGWEDDNNPTLSALIR